MLSFIWCLRPDLNRQGIAIPRGFKFRVEPRSYAVLRVFFCLKIALYGLTNEQLSEYVCLSINYQPSFEIW